MSQTDRPASSTPSCPDCRDDRFSRRDAIRRATGAVVAGAAASAGLFELVVRPRSLLAADGVAAPGAGAAPATVASETLVAQLHKSLSDEQRKTLCFPFDHPLRLKVDNNWTIVKQTIDKALNPDQRDLVKQIFMGLHSPEYAQRVYDQVEHDGGGKGSFFEECAVALFGEPAVGKPAVGEPAVGEPAVGKPDASGGAAKGKFEFVLTGRHCTRRCDGNSVAGAAFGGPIFYGHAADGFNEKADHKGNAYWYQAVSANEVFKALDGRQRKLALRSDPRKEQGNKTVELKGTRDGLAGVPMTELSKDQQQLVRTVLGDLLAPFRKPDADEAMKLVEAGGFDHLHLAFYKNMDIGDDGVWDVWQVEGPHMLWYFRGAPHVHTWVNIRDPAAAKA